MALQSEIDAIYSTYLTSIWGLAICAPTSQAMGGSGSHRAAMVSRCPTGCHSTRVLVWKDGVKRDLVDEHEGYRQASSDAGQENDGDGDNGYILEWFPFLQLYFTHCQPPRF
jgi:hypothetical protein